MPGAATGAANGGCFGACRQSRPVLQHPLPRPGSCLYHPFPPFLLGRDSADSDQRKREEDFYYTEVQVKEEPAPEAAASPTSVSASAPIVIQQALAKPEALLLEPPALEPALGSSALSQSAPSSFWHIQADHAYQVSCCRLLPCQRPGGGLGGSGGCR